MDEEKRNQIIFALNESESTLVPDLLEYLNTQFMLSEFTAEPNGEWTDIYATSHSLSHNMFIALCVCYRVAIGEWVENKKFLDKTT